jgi:putative protein-disulfide isomerase
MPDRGRRLLCEEKETALADLVAESGLDCDLFLQAFRSEEAGQETWQDFAIAQTAGIRGFPSLIAGIGEETEHSIVTLGFQPADRIIPPLERWLEILHASAPESMACKRT